MAEHHLDGAEIGAALEQMGGEGVAQGVRSYRTAYACQPGVVADYHEHHVAGESAAAAPEYEGVFVAGGGDDVAACAGHVFGDESAVVVVHGHHAFFRSFAGDHQIVVFEIDARHLQGDEFAHTQSAAVQGFDYQAVALFQRVAQVEGGADGVDFRGGEYSGQMGGKLWRFEKHRGVVAAAAVAHKPPEERTHGRDDACNRARRQMERRQVGHIAVEIFGVGACRVGAVVGHGLQKAADVGGVGVDGVLRESAFELKMPRVGPQQALCLNSGSRLSRAP